MSKSDLKARPIFHRKRDAIEAHLTVVMAALAIQRRVERQAGITLVKIIKVLRPIRSGTVIIAGKEYAALLFSRRFLYFLDDVRVSIIIVKSSSSPYSTTAAWGEPCELVVATTAKSLDLIKSKTSSLIIFEV